MNAKNLLIKKIKETNADELKDYILTQLEDLDVSDFQGGHDNGYNDGNGALQDVYVTLLFDCRG